jgi:hypothetical protein
MIGSHLGIHSYIPMIDETVPVVDPGGTRLLFVSGTLLPLWLWK